MLLVNDHQAQATPCLQAKGGMCAHQQLHVTAGSTLGQTALLSGLPQQGTTKQGGFDTAAVEQALV